DDRACSGGGADGEAEGSVERGSSRERGPGQAEIVGQRAGDDRVADGPASCAGEGVGVGGSDLPVGWCGGGDDDVLVDDEGVVGDGVGADAVAHGDLYGEAASGGGGSADGSARGVDAEPEWGQVAGAELQRRVARSGDGE